MTLINEVFSRDVDVKKVGQGQAGQARPRKIRKDKNKVNYRLDQHVVFPIEQDDFVVLVQRFDVILCGRIEHAIP